MRCLNSSRPCAPTLAKGPQHPAVVLHKPSKLRKSSRVNRTAAVDEAVEVAAPAAEVVTESTTDAAVSAVNSPAAVPEVPELTAAQRLYQEQAARSLKAATSNAAESSSGQGVELPDLGAAASNLSSSASKAVDNINDAASKAADSLSSAFSGFTSGLTSTVTDVTGGVGSKVTDVTSSLGKGAGDVAGQVSGSVSGAVSSLQSGLNQVKGNLDQATAGISSSVGQAVNQFTESTQAVTSAVGDTLSSGEAAVRQTLDSVSTQVNAVTTQVTTAVDATTTQVLDALPPPVKDAALAVGGVVGTAAQAAVAHPQVTAAVTAAVAIPTAINYYKSRYGGYAGELSPLKVAELLASDDDAVFLVDIRPEATRESEGLPELKLGARFKVAAYPLQTGLVPKRVAKEAVNADELSLMINAAYITGFPQCQGNLTKLIIMDSTGSDKARALARALVTLGYGLSFVMEGGFNAWMEAELPVLEDAVEYDASTGAVISDNIEVVASKATEVATTLSQPQVGVPLLGGTLLGGYAVYNYHSTLQFIGVLSVLLTITNKLLSYESPRDLIDDVSNTASNIGKSVSNFKLPSAPKLPTVPKLPGSLGGAAAAVPATAGYSASMSVAEDNKQEEVEQAPAETEVVEQQ